MLMVSGGKVMDVRIGKYAGFCFGVKRAVSLALKATKDNNLPRPIITWGQLIHNPQFINYLEAKGIKWIDCMDNLPRDGPGTIIVRSHGISPVISSELINRGWKIVDATCPYVKEAQKAAANLSQNGYQVIIYGEETHPEVQGILGFISKEGKCVINSQELNKIALEHRVGLVAQTTKDMSVFLDIASALISKVKELCIYNTICLVTSAREKNAIELAQQADLVLVVGGVNSSNTRNLFKVVQKTQTKAHHIQGKADIDPKWFESIDLVGIVAGASTPNWIIKEVEELMLTMSEEKKNENTEQEELKEEKTIVDENLEKEIKEESSDEGVNEPSENTVVPDTPEIAETQTEKHPMEEETIDYTSGLNALHRGQIICGKVVEINDEGAFVDISDKTEGFVPKRELDNNPVANVGDIVKAGDEIFVAFMGRDEDGAAKLSKRKADSEQAWEKVKTAQAEDLSITGTVTKVVKGGLVVDIGLRGFVPASHAAIEFVENLDQFVGQELDFKVLEVEKKNNNVVLSRKKVLEKIQNEQKDQTMANLKQGAVVSGKVTKIVDFGAFVDIGGIEGLLHISEISWGRIEHPSKVLTEGEDIDVKVLNIEPEKERISLGLKQILPDPWETFLQKYQDGDTVVGSITKTVSFGAFMEIQDGIEGLIHISQLARRHVETADEVVKQGDKVEAKIININEAERKVGLSLKELEEEIVKPQPKVAAEKTDKKDAVDEDEGKITIGDHIDLDQFNFDDLEEK